MRRALNGLFLASGALAAACIAAVFALMIFASIGRMAGWRVGGVNDIVSWLTAAAAFLAMAHSFKNGDFVRVTLLLDSLGERARKTFEVVSLSIAALAIGYLAFWAARFTWESREFGDMAGGLVAIPIWIPQLTFVVGALLFWLAVLDELVLVLQDERPTYVRLVEERHARGDFSEDI